MIVDDHEEIREVIQVLLSNEGYQIIEAQNGKEALELLDETIDLIILGMLIEKPQSAYDLQKDIEYHHFDRWSKISIPSIYKKVIQLEEKGFLTSEVSNSGKLSNKAIYSITETGKDYFQRLMTDLSETTPTILLDMNILIANITKLSKNKSIELLSNLKKGLSDALLSAREWEKEFSDIPFNGRAIISQQVEVYNLLLEWLNNFEYQYVVQKNGND